MRRPVPHRGDSIGPWLNSLGFLTWMGSITSAALVYLFSTPAGGGQPSAITLAGILGSIVFSEHIYFVAQLVVRTALSKLDSPGLIKERQERFLVRRRYLQESMGVDKETEAREIVGSARLDGEPKNPRFWDRQEGPKSSIEYGKHIICGGRKDD